MRHSTTRYSFFLIMVMVVSVLILSCIGTTPPAVFYTLSTMQEGNSSYQIPQEMAIAIGPVRLPAELDRSQILIRDTENRITLAEFHRWAGPLQERIASVLARNLATLLGTQRIAPRGRENIFPFTHYIVLSINRFDGQLQGEVLLDVTWSIRADNQQETQIVKRSVIHETVSTPDYDGLVAAQSTALAELSRQIAESVGKLGFQK